jgi:hypothetical protein
LPRGARGGDEVIAAAIGGSAGVEVITMVWLSRILKVGSNVADGVVSKAAPLAADGVTK